MYKIAFFLKKKKDVKSLVRDGIPAQYRSQLWKIFIDYHVKDLKELKGPNYYSYLCNLIDESPVIFSNDLKI